MKINYKIITKAAEVLRSVNHDLRQEIIELIDRNVSMNVSEIYLKLRLEQSVASQHLAILRREGIVKTFREGKKIIYSVNYDRLAEIQRYSADIAST